MLRATTFGIAASMLLCGCAAEPRSRFDTPRRVAVQSSVAPWEYDGAAGHVIRTDHYVVYTTLVDAGMLAALPQALEMAYRFYSQLVPTAVEGREPMTLYVFASRGQWERFTRAFAGARAATLLKVRNGGYMERGVSVVEYVTHAIAFPVVAHEGFHQYLHYHANQLAPAWLHEGLAVVCEGQRWGREGLAAFDPWYNPARRNALAEALLRGELFRVDELLRMNAGHVVGGSTRRIVTYYAQLWALMLFMNEGADGRYRAGFEAMLDTLGAQNLEGIARTAPPDSGDPRSQFGRALFERFITTDLATFEGEYVEFMRRRILGTTRAAQAAGAGS